MRKKILFMVEDLTLAHVSRSLVLAESLDKTKYDVTFASGNKYSEIIHSTNIKHHEIPTISSNVFLQRLAKSKPIFNKNELSDNVDMDLKLLKKIKPDLVLGDFRLSLGVSTRLTKSSYFCLSSACWAPNSELDFPMPEHILISLLGVTIGSYVIPPFLPIFMKPHTKPFNYIRKKFNLSELKTLHEIYSYADKTLFLDLPRLSPLKYKIKNQEFIGPVIWSPNIPLPKSLKNIDEKKPLIYISLGSSGNISSLEKLLDILKEMNVTAIVSTGGRFDSYMSKNIIIEKYLPGSVLAEKSDIMICNGGTSSTYQGLSEGSPILAIPCNPDQYYSSTALELNKVGILIRSNMVRKKNVLKAIDALLNDPSYKKRASEIKQEIKNFNTIERFKKLIDAHCFQIDYKVAA